MIKQFYTLGLLALMVVLTSCHGKDSGIDPRKEKIIVAASKQSEQKLYYGGVLEPLNMRSVLSPMEGRVDELYFSYGQFVTKGQALFAIDSLSLTQDYQKSVTNYLQRKSEYSNSLEEFRGSTALFKAGVISREEFLHSRSQYRTTQLNYYEARYAMEKILSKANVDPKTIEDLTLEDVPRIDQLLQRQFKHIVIRSNADGIALFPINNGNGSSDEANNKRLELGSSVKQGQLLLSVGDLRGLSTRVFVNEIDIDRIKKGTSALVTLSAFPDIQLKAYVSAVSSQAKSSNPGSALSEFPVVIKIPQLTPHQRDIVRVGMTAKVQIVIHQDSTVVLPINAIYEKNGQSMVTVLNKQGRRENVPVVVGFTTLTDVAVLQGVKPGDRVVMSTGSKNGSFS